MEQFHIYQKQILKSLMYKSSLRFNELMIPELSSKHFNYHLKKLIEGGYVTNKNRQYILTDEGKELVGRMDEMEMDLEKQSKVSVAIFVQRGVGENEEYLVNKRLKEPYKNLVGGFTGKIRFSETFEQGARRELFEETGLTGDFEFIDVYHKLAYKKMEDGNTKIIQDVTMIDFKVTHIKGKLSDKNDDLESFWMSYKELVKRKDLFNTFLDKLEFVRNPQKGVQFREIITEAEGY